MQHFVAEIAGHAFGVGGDLFQRLAGEDADAEALLHVSAHFAAHIGIEQQQDVFEQLDDGDLHAEHRRHAGQFAADEAAAEHQHGRGQPREVEEPAAFHHALVLRQEAGHDRGGTGGDDDLPGADGLGRGRRDACPTSGNGDGVAVLEGGDAGELLHAVGGEQLLDAALELADDLVLVADHHGVIHRRRP